MVSDGNWIRQARDVAEAAVHGLWCRTDKHDGALRLDSAWMLESQFTYGIDICLSKWWTVLQPLRWTPY